MSINLVGYDPTPEDQRYVSEMRQKIAQYRRREAKQKSSRPPEKGQQAASMTTEETPPAAEKIDAGKENNPAPQAPSPH